MEAPWGGEVVPLDEEQREAVALALSGASFFLTGEAGTGKSATLRAIITALTARYGGDAVGVTASTGLAAAALGGTTLHAWAGVGLATAPTDDLVRYMRKGARARWARTRVLLIDEVSMLSAPFFTTVADVGAGVRRARGGESFGGIQVIGVGDFLQLPPVVSSSPWRGGGGAQDGGERAAGFAFQSPVWGGLFSRTLLLRRVHRQADPAFVAVLNEVGARVICVKNVAPAAGVVNGAAGVVVDFPHWPARAAPVYPFVRFDSGTCALLLPTADDLVDADGVVVATRTQLPLTLGWALTVHGAQGMSLARVEVDLSVAFEAGMVYVALSRATSADGLRVASLNLDRFALSLLSLTPADFGLVRQLAQLAQCGQLSLQLHQYCTAI
ncbi:hypothetical protein I4F81_005068 [Pyropia yezoensis]|uniref:Uncharacterized protein n=1 Tax=Pyropia yezoensis TaxID=2788 RepID=A0ACC3BX30_PYRYE|nr:hypothetical protein I4F81_005068 [Neopyropia yezoensis]